VPVPTFAPPDQEFTRPFWEGIAAGELRLPRCRACGAWQWYPLPGTDHCPGAPSEWTPVRAEGIVFTFTEVRRPFLPGATKADVPFTTVLLELDDAPGLRFVGRLRDGAQVAVGTRVRGAFVERDGRADLEFAPI
jgi:uncharacterized OB-fold protein